MTNVTYENQDEGCEPDTHTYEHSVAISLKRIADALERLSEQKALSDEVYTKQS